MTTQRAVHEERLARYRAGRAALASASGSSARMATLEFGLRHEAAVLDWFDALPATLGGRPLTFHCGRSSLRS